jgi:hypothetical protein
MHGSDEVGTGTVPCCLFALTSWSASPGEGTTLAGTTCPSLLHGPGSILNRLGSSLGCALSPCRHVSSWHAPSCLRRRNQLSVMRTLRIRYSAASRKHTFPPLADARLFCAASNTVIGRASTNECPSEFDGESQTQDGDGTLRSNS